MILDYSIDDLITKTPSQLAYVESAPSGTNSYAASVNPASLDAGEIQTSLDVRKTGHIRGGQTAYATGTGFFLGYSTDAYKFSIGDSTNYLRWDGTRFVYTGQTRASIIGYSRFEDTNGLSNTAVGGTGAVTASAQGLNVRTASTANSFAETALVMGTANFEPFRNAAFSAFCDLQILGTGAGNNGNFYIGVSGALAAHTGTTMTLTQNQFGFKILKVNGVSTLYATNANGTTETTTSIQTVTSGSSLLLSAAYISGSIYFYVDGVLVATHTTNLPSVATVGTLFMAVFVNNANTANDTAIGVASFNYEHFVGIA